ncbi:MAG TPA: TonB-dependent receptor [Bryobacteraceae bacterium]
MPSPDAIEEFKVQTNLLPAEFGRSLGGAINMTIRSGTNDLHGTAFEFLRNSHMDANAYFNSGRVKPQFQQNQFGFSAGGPVIIPKLYNGKNRTFIFGDYQGTRVRKGLTSVLSVPTGPERLGNFAGTPTLYDPSTTVTGTNGQTTRQAFAGNQIPMNRFSPSAIKLLAFEPPPNAPGTVNNFVLNPKHSENENKGDIKVDQTFSPKDTMFVRYSVSRDAQYQPWNIPGLPFGGYFNDPNSQPTLTNGSGAALGYIHTFSPTIVNEFRAGYNRLYKVIQTASNDQNIAATYGIPGVPDNPGANGLTSINISGLSPLGDNIDRHNGQNVFQVLDFVTFVKGNHTLKFGFDHRRTQLNENQGSSPRGSFTFDGVFTQNPLSRSGSGNSVADFLLGAADTSAIGGVVSDGARIRNYSYFAQDDWKINSRLTMNIGLRYEYVTPVTATANRLTSFDPATNNLIFAKAGSIYDQALSYPDRNNWAPRIGLAYQLFPKTVIRAGFGMYYTLEDAGEHVLLFNPPRVSVRNTLSDQLNLSTSPLLDAGFPPYVATTNFQNKFLSIAGRPSNFPAAYSEQWNFTIEHQVAGFLIEAAYVGNEAHKLIANTNINQPMPAAGPVNSRRPFPGWGDITFQMPRGNSIYHGLQMKVEKHLGAAGTILISDSFAKAIDDSEETQITNNTDPSSPQSVYNLRAERGLASVDIRNRFVASYVYELPFGRGKALFSGAGRLANLFIGGWQINGVTTIQTGQPFTVNTSFDQSNTNSAAPRPNSTGVNPALSSAQQSVQEWFNIAAFALPSGYAFGNLGRNTLIGPGLVNFDFAGFKNFSVSGEGKRIIQFRSEFYNIANHPQLATPNRLFGAAGFGSITSVVNSSRDIQMGLKFIW